MQLQKFYIVDVFAETKYTGNQLLFRRLRPLVRWIRN
jgi:hypothetical protein